MAQLVAPSTVEQLNMAVGRLSPIVTCHRSGHLHEDGNRPTSSQPACTSRTRIVIQYRELNIATVPNIRGKKSSRIDNKSGPIFSIHPPVRANLSIPHSHVLPPPIQPTCKPKKMLKRDNLKQPCYGAIGLKTPRNGVLRDKSERNGLET